MLDATIDFESAHTEGKTQGIQIKAVLRRVRAITGRLMIHNYRNSVEDSVMNRVVAN
jgi:hypothetical protein